MSISFKNDKDFDSLLPAEIRQKADIHFSPIDVIERCIEFFEENNVSNVLDIGSGVGKFCIVGAHLSDMHFTGIEIRQSLHLVGQNILEQTKKTSVNLLNMNITEVPFGQFDGFYYFNPFFENIAEEGQIDHKLSTKVQNFNHYTTYVEIALNAAPAGSCLASYWTPHSAIPPSFLLTDSYGELSFWRKS